MNDWMEPFLWMCVGEIPASPYREQVKKELADHLETAARTLEEGGCTQQEARRLALSRMGDPVELSRRFQREGLRRQAVNPGYCISTLLFGCFIAGFMYIFSTFPLGLLLSWRNLGPLFPWYVLMIGIPHQLQCGIYRALFGCGMFLLPFGVSARYLMKSFRFHPRRELIVTCGLWISWAVEKLAGLALGKLIYVHYYTIQDLPALVERISGGGDGFAPWFTAPYILLSFIGCPLLALAASRLDDAARAREKRLA